MESFVNFLQVFVGDVSIDLGRGYVGVAQERLYAAKVGAIFEQIGCE